MQMNQQMKISVARVRDPMKPVSQIDAEGHICLPIFREAAIIFDVEGRQDNGYPTSALGNLRRPVCANYASGLLSRLLLTINVLYECFSRGYLLARRS